MRSSAKTSTWCAAGQILNIPDARRGVARSSARTRTGWCRRISPTSTNTAAASPARRRAAESAPGQRESTGRIEPQAGAAPPAGAQDQLKLSKADPQKPVAPPDRARPQGDDAVARERALKEAQSRVTDLEKNVADLQKLLELKNQQLAELEREAGGKPAAAPAPAPAPAAKAPEPAKPAAPPLAAPAPAGEGARARQARCPALAAGRGASAGACEAAPNRPKRAPNRRNRRRTGETRRRAGEPPPRASRRRPRRKRHPASAPAQDQPASTEFLDNRIALGGLGFVVLLLVGYGAWAWSRKKGPGKVSR